MNELEKGLNGTTSADIAEMQTNRYTFSPLPVGDLSIMMDNGKRLYKYKPKDDITTIELAHMIHLMMACMSAGKHFVMYDYASFIHQHGLERHFEEQLT